MLRWLGNLVGPVAGPNEPSSPPTRDLSPPRTLSSPSIQRLSRPSRLATAADSIVLEYERRVRHEATERVKREPSEVSLAFSASESTSAASARSRRVHFTPPPPPPPPSRRLKREATEVDFSQLSQIKRLDTEIDLVATDPALVPIGTPVPDFASASPARGVTYDSVRGIRLRTEEEDRLIHEQQLLVLQQQRDLRNSVSLGAIYEEEDEDDEDDDASSEDGDASVSDDQSDVDVSDAATEILDSSPTPYSRTSTAAVLEIISGNDDDTTSEASAADLEACPLNKNTQPSSSSARSAIPSSSGSVFGPVKSPATSGNEIEPVLSADPPIPPIATPAPANISDTDCSSSQASSASLPAHPVSHNATPKKVVGVKQPWQSRPPWNPHRIHIPRSSFDVLNDPRVRPRRLLLSCLETEEKIFHRLQVTMAEREKAKAQAKAHQEAKEAAARLAEEARRLEEAQAAREREEAERAAELQRVLNDVLQNYDQATWHYQFVQKVEQEDAKVDETYVYRETLLTEYWRYEEKWEALKRMKVDGDLDWSLDQLPWPIHPEDAKALCGPLDITVQHIANFILHPLRPGLDVLDWNSRKKILREEQLRWDPTAFYLDSMDKVGQTESPIALAGVEHIHKIIGAVLQIEEYLY